VAYPLEVGVVAEGHDVVDEQDHDGGADPQNHE
jgi:hypothetical protein